MKRNQEKGDDTMKKLLTGAIVITLVLAVLISAQEARVAEDAVQDEIAAQAVREARSADIPLGVEDVQAEELKQQERPIFGDNAFVIYLTSLLSDDQIQRIEENQKKGFIEVLLEKISAL